ncbi:hypothetical protein BKA70DRAFT_1315719 [Coprinopsis sp. MPI-PUGE-AT-0042]|nr:hypothetical protein BKA70DRAFT_1315719 [Coprinopsis sp. MPI-PUGE-AT-0042]
MNRRTGRSLDRVQRADDALTQDHNDDEERPLLVNVPGGIYDDVDDGFEAHDMRPNWGQPEGVVLGPKEDRAHNLSWIATALNSPGTIFCLLSLALLLHGWILQAGMSKLSQDCVHSDWAKEYQRHLEQMQAERAQWEIERKGWVEEDRAREKVQQAERLLEVDRQRRKDKEERQEGERRRARVRWAKPQPDTHCLRFGTRKWTAKLEDLPADYNPVTMCQETKALIHGRWLLPNECEVDTRAGTFGTWYIDFNEAACRTRWSPISDKGCTSEGSGKRKFEGQLENVRSGDDWAAMCSSTPAEFQGLRFDGPHSCDDWGIWGYRGFWFIEDAACN